LPAKKNPVNRLVHRARPEAMEVDTRPIETSLSGLGVFDLPPGAPPER
jgi:hypothetical protein